VPFDEVLLRPIKIEHLQTVIRQSTGRREPKNP
jgi:hypothetical protein